MATKKFIRQDSGRHSKIGKNRKKLQKWRKPKGRDSKMRLKMFSYPVSPSVGYKTPRKDSGKINGLNPVLINNLKDLSKVTKQDILIISRRLGVKKKLEIIKKSEEMKLKILNISKETKK